MQQPQIILEEKIAPLFGFDHGLLLGRARSSLVALIKILHNKDTLPLPVVLPENICSALVTAIRAGGGQAIPVPVSGDTGLPTDQAFAQTMEQTKGNGIFMPVHLYGFQCPYPQAIAKAREKGWFILENDACATRFQNPHTRPTPPAPYGDALLVSFGYAKPIEHGSAGALLSNDPALIKSLREASRAFPPMLDKDKAAEQNCMLARRALRNGQMPQNQMIDTVGKICRIEEGLSSFSFNPEDIDALSPLLDAFPEQLRQRRERKLYWDIALEPLKDILKPVSLEQPVPWRLIRTVKTSRDSFTEALWRSGFDAGINYRSLWQEVPAHYLQGKQSKSDIWGDSVLNLWLTEGYNEERINRAVDVLKGVADE